MKKKTIEILERYFNDDELFNNGAAEELLLLFGVSNSVCLHEPQYQSYNSATKLQTCDKCKEITN